MSRLDPAASDAFFASTLLDVPRPFLDPITTIGELLGVASLICRRPRRAQTVSIILDARRRGIRMTRYSQLDVVVFHDIVTEMSSIESAASVMLVTTTTLPPDREENSPLCTIGRMILTNAGFELREWVVAGCGGFHLPTAGSSFPADRSSPADPT